MTRFNLGMVAYTFGDLATARQQFDQARVVWAEGGMRTAVFSHVAVAGLASVAHHEGDDEEALRLHDQSVAALRAALAGDHPIKATVIAERGTTLLEMGRVEDAKAATSEALGMFERSVGADSYGAAAVMLIDAHARLKLGDVDAAQAGYRRAQKIIDGLGNDLHPALSSVYAGLAEVARRRGDEDAQREQLALLARIEAAYPGMPTWAREGLRR